MTKLGTWRLDADAAAFYERHFVPALFGQWAPLLADAASLAPGQHVLDVACGTGVVAREATRRVGPTGRVVGVDLNASMLAQARRAAPTLEWHQGDAADLPFDEGSFDAVLCQAALMFFPDRVAALREMRRVLRPGGALAVLVFGASPGYEALGGVLEEIAGREVAEIFRAPFCLSDPQSVTALLAEAGFGTFEVVTRVLPARFPSVQQLLRTEVDGWVLKGRVDLDAALPLARERLAAFVSPTGEVRLPMDAHLVTSAKA